MSPRAEELVRLVTRDVCGVHPRPMKQLFDHAKAFLDLNIEDLAELLEEEPYEIRMAAVCVMDFQARSGKTPNQRLKELYELYLLLHDRIDTWDMVDRAAPHVVGKFLFDKDREPLYELARSGSEFEKRTAIVSTWYFIKNGQTDDTFAIAEILVHDQSDVVALAVGSWVREAGKRDSERLLAFLDKNATVMHRGALRTAIEKLPNPMRQHYLS